METFVVRSFVRRLVGPASKYGTMVDYKRYLLERWQEVEQKTERKEEEAIVKSLL